MSILQWIQQELHPVMCNSVEFFYDEMESQSDFSLPIIYQPYDPHNRSHWADRGSLFDFLFSTCGSTCTDKTLLDFGPGDGWPSLNVAPYVKEVIGVDGSHRRVKVCQENARRLGINNARFIYVEPGARLPFAEFSFDGVMAASSLEQTPDPRMTLSELYRVLRPEGRLRISYESLSRYRNCAEQAADLSQASGGGCWLTIYHRQVKAEQADMLRLKFNLPVKVLRQAFENASDEHLFTHLTPERLIALKSALITAKHCTLNHPFSRTLASWMQQAGFRIIIPTHSGEDFAQKYFDALERSALPVNLAGVDSHLRLAVKVVSKLPAPYGDEKFPDPMLTAIK
ncbi:MAG TPA: class I SAM-dependent methyltransferase [Anaerolineaceae bacterium]